MRRRPYATALMLGSILAAWPVQAQVRTEEGQASSGTKTYTSLAKTQQSISVITAEHIARRTADLLEATEIHGCVEPAQLELVIAFRVRAARFRRAAGDEAERLIEGLQAAPGNASPQVDVAPSLNGLGPIYATVVVPTTPEAIGEEFSIDAR